ncbi:MAG: hypothetical protein AB4368_13685 [Xenococcaceae cyanobacterium]
MRYSLLSRFQGTLLGSIIGDALTIEQSGSLTNRQDDWCDIFNYHPSPWANRLTQVCRAINESARPEQFKLDNSAEWAYLTVPIVLFYHDNKLLLRQEIERLARYWQWSADILADVLLWSDIFVLILKEKLDTNNIIEQFLRGVRVEETPLWQLLKSMTSWLSEGRSLEQVKEQLSSKTQEYSLPLSLYCFSSTPENFYLALSRAAGDRARSRMVIRLTGALAGGYNTVSGIPITWRKLLAQNAEYQKIKQEGTILLNNWSGGYQRGRLTAAKTKQKVIAAPGIIQTRSSLRVISQQE